MQIITNGRNIELTPAIKETVETKLGKLSKHYDFIQEIHVILCVEKNPRINESQVAEATVHVPSAVIRVEAASSSLYTSIDQLHDKIERSLSKHKSRLVDHHGKGHHEDLISMDHSNDDLNADDDDTSGVDSDVRIVAVD